MSSPKEPGTGPDGGSLGNSAARGAPPPSGPAPARSAEHGDVPPWQRGPVTRPKPQQPPEAAQSTDGPRSGPSGLDARLNRFIAGSPTPSAGTSETDPASRGESGTRTESGTRGEASSAAYGSELPDLSDAPPRPQQQRKPVDRPAADQPAKVPAQAPAASRAVQVATRQHQGPVRASMQIRRIDPWSALKVSVVLSVAMFFVWMIAIAFLYLVLGGMGVWSKLNSNVGDLLTSASGSAGGELVSSGTIFGGAALIGLVNIVLMTAAATIGAFIYNLTTDLVGGVEVTLADRD